MKTAPLTQYVRRSSHEKFLFTENARRGWYKRAPLTQYVKQSWHVKAIFTKMVDEVGIKKLLWLKDTHRGKAPSNKTSPPTESRNMGSRYI